MLHARITWLPIFQHFPRQGFSLSLSATLLLRTLGTETLWHTHPVQQRQPQGVALTQPKHSSREVLCFQVGLNGQNCPEDISLTHLHLASRILLKSNVRRADGHKARPLGSTEQQGLLITDMGSTERQGLLITDPDELVSEDTVPYTRLRYTCHVHYKLSGRQMLAAELPVAQACANVNTEEEVESAPYPLSSLSKSQVS